MKLISIFTLIFLHSAVLAFPSHHGNTPALYTTVEGDVFQNELSSSQHGAIAGLRIWLASVEIPHPKCLNTLLHKHSSSIEEDSETPASSFPLSASSIDKAPLSTIELRDLKANAALNPYLDTEPELVPRKFTSSKKKKKTPVSTIVVIVVVVVIVIIICLVIYFYIQSRKKNANATQLNQMQPGGYSYN